MSRRRTHLLAVLLLTAIVVAAYAGSLSNGFVYDDDVLIVKNELITDLRHLPVLVSTSYFERSTVVSYRPILTLSYFLDYALWGLSPFGFHLTNLLLHLLTTLGVYALFTRLLSASPFTHSLPSPPPLPNVEGEGVVGPWLALLGAALFAVHPVLANAVDNLGHRSDPLATALVIWALCGLLWRERRPHSTPSWGLTAAGLTAYGLALLAKESAVVLPLLLVAIDWARGRLDQRGWRARLPLYGGLAAITAGYLVLRFVVMVSPVEGTLASTPLTERLLGWPFATWTHLRLLVLPVNLSAEHSFLPPQHLTDPMVVFPVAVLTALLIGVIWLIYQTQQTQRNQRNQRNHRLTVLGLVWIAVSLGPVANIAQNFSLPIAERYLYLPAIGYALLLTLMLERLRRPAMITGLAGVLVLTGGALTMERHRVWRDNLTLWQDIVEQIPGEPIAHNNLGAAYEAHGDVPKALEHYAWATALAPTFVTPYLNAAQLYLRPDRPAMVASVAAAGRVLRQALGANPGHPAILATLGLVYQRQGRPEAAIPLYRAAIARDPRHADVWTNLGTAFAATGHRAEALIALERAVALTPSEAVIYHNLGTLYADEGRLEEAVRAYREALRLNPTLAGTRENLAILSTRLGR